VSPRLEEDPFAIAVDEVLHDLIGLLTRGEALTDERAHLVGHLRR
jgi:hypothetical protein